MEKAKHSVNAHHIALSQAKCLLCTGNSWDLFEDIGIL